MLRFFFRHYDRFVTRYVIFDDGSTDGSIELLRSNPRVELHRFVRSDPESFCLSEQELSNECWRSSSSSADWVIVTDIDEHLYHPQMPTLLSRYKELGITLVPALGYQMISEQFPHDDELLCETRFRGAPWPHMCKLSLFDPAAITAINYDPGRHLARPEGHLVLPERDEVLLLHYKFLGFERMRARHGELLSGLGTKDIANNWGHQYAWPEPRLREDWDTVARNAVDIRGLSPGDSYPLNLWWARYRQTCAPTVNPA